MKQSHTLSLAACLSGLMALGTIAWPPAAVGGAPPQGYVDHSALAAAAQELAANPRCRVDVIGASRQGRGLLLLTLAADPLQAGAKPAMLITAGLDGRHRVGVEVALRLARILVDDHSELLDDMTVYVIPCANPDGLERNIELNSGHIGTMREVDEDRDGAANEDPPVDLNGDGHISMMRRLDPPLDDKATHVPDPVAPRLLKTPDSEKGERAIYSIYVEGLDQDGDGQIAEDGPGQVDLDRNFMHRWPEHEAGAGPIQLSEPESAALAKFVLEHRNIVQAITLGRHDNLINVPDGKAKEASSAPKDLDPDDVAWYKELSKKFKEITGQERAPSEDGAGSFHAWLYAQRGIASLATVVWGRPEASKKEPPAAETQPAPETQPSPETQPATAPDSDNAKAQATAEGDKKKKEKKEEPKPADAEAAAWLEYSDRDRNGEGFIEWTPFDHPTLGKVEIGGFVPGFQMNPPADQLDELAKKHATFVVELMNKRPKLSLQGPDVKRLGAGLFEVRFGIVNEGYLPTASTMARKARSIMPTVVRISTPVENIVAGERVSKIWGVGGGGERSAHRWILRVDEGSELTIDLVNPHLGNQSITFKAEETK